MIDSPDRILRYRSPGCKHLGGPRKTGNAGDRLNMHVDDDKRVLRHGSSVMIMSLGDPIKFGVCRYDVARPAPPPQQQCRRYGTMLARMDAKDKDKKWSEIECERCQEIVVRSGDIVLFNGHPTACVAHGVIGKIAGETGPTEGMPTWAQGCRLGVQYRMYAPEGDTEPPPAKRARTD